MEHIDFEKAAAEIINFCDHPDFGWYDRQKTATDLADLWIEFQYAGENPPTWSDERVEEIYDCLAKELFRAGLRWG